MLYIDALKHVFKKKKDFQTLITFYSAEKCKSQCCFSRFALTVSRLLTDYCEITVCSAGLF